MTPLPLRNEDHIPCTCSVLQYLQPREGQGNFDLTCDIFRRISKTPNPACRWNDV